MRSSQGSLLQGRGAAEEETKAAQLRVHVGGQGGAAKIRVAIRRQRGVAKVRVDIEGKGGAVDTKSSPRTVIDDRSRLTTGEGRPAQTLYEQAATRTAFYKTEDY